MSERTYHGATPRSPNVGPKLRERYLMRQDNTIYTFSIKLSFSSLTCEGRKEGNVLFNDALNTFYLRLYGVRHMVKDHSDSEKGNPLPPHRLLFPISSKGSFICTIPQTG